MWRGPAVAAAGTAAVLVWDPFERTFEVCPLHATTGLLCPACGATRAWYLLAHGDVGEALRFNAPLVLVAGWLTVWWAVLVWRTAGRRPVGATWPAPLRPPGRFGARLRVAALVALGVFTVARNLPGVDWLGPA